MTRLNEDGNLLGRIGALACLAAIAVLLGRICCGGALCSVCPIPHAGPSASSVKTPR